MSSDKGKGIVVTFNTTTHDQLYSEIARMVYYVGLPFHLVRNLYYVISFTFAMNNFLSCYLSLDCNLLGITLL